MSTSNENKSGWCSMTMESRSKLGGALKPHELSAKLKKGSHPWDGKLYPVIRNEWWGVCAGMQGFQAASQR
eukprot:1155501-Pelagomonas_calceolata.AAC.2